MAGGDSDERAATLGRLPGRQRAQRSYASIAGWPSPDSQCNRPRSMLSATMSSGALAERRAALRERQRALGLQRRRLRQRGVEVGARRLGRFGAVEMLGDERGIAIAVPLRGGAMQLRAAGARERRVDAVADQRVREQELVALPGGRESAPSARRTNSPAAARARAPARAGNAGRRPPPPAAPRGRAPAAGPSARARDWKATPEARPPSRRRRASAARGTAGCRRSARRTFAQTRTAPQRSRPRAPAHPSRRADPGRSSATDFPAPMPATRR